MSNDSKADGGRFVFGNPIKSPNEKDGFSLGDSRQLQNPSEATPVIRSNPVTREAPSYSPAPVSTPKGSSPDLIGDLNRLARFGANILDAHSCLIFIPQSILAPLVTPPRNMQGESTEGIVLAGIHSLSTEVIRGITLKAETGLIGWVAKNKRPIHVSPFERDSRILGVYATDQHLKSFLGTPVLCSKNNPAAIAGVIACDSKKAFAFSKLQGKLLEDLSEEVAAVIELHKKITEERQSPMSWSGFLEKGYDLVDAIGERSMQAIRCQLENASSVEKDLGTYECLALVDQIFRLIVQSVPPHFPVFRSPLGEILILVDNMMGDLTINKIEAIVDRVKRGRPLKIRFRRSSYSSQRNFSLESLISETHFSTEINDDEIEAVPLKRKVFGFR